MENGSADVLLRYIDVFLARSVKIEEVKAHLQVVELTWNAPITFYLRKLKKDGAQTSLFASPKPGRLRPYNKVESTSRVFIALRRGQQGLDDT